MEPKPAQWHAWVPDAATADAYPHRPPYPPEAIGLLVDLVRDAPRTVLDAGCGTGDLARALLSPVHPLRRAQTRRLPSSLRSSVQTAPRGSHSLPQPSLVERVDAVDPSAAMLAQGRRLPGGDHPQLRWQQATVETAELTPPYALVVAGESLHWMDWPVALPRFADALAPHGALAIVERDFDGPPELAARLRPVFAQYSVVRDFRPMDVVAEIERRGLFTRLGERRCGPQPWRPTIEEYLECRHSQRGFSRTQMGADAAAAFDAAIRGLLGEGRLDLSVTARVVWGRPIG
jgi:SAM-dependent methyltransferase